jgi:hypothetical protein
MTAFWDIAPCSPIEEDQRFIGTSPIIIIIIIIITTTTMVMKAVSTSEMCVY